MSGEVNMRIDEVINGLNDLRRHLEDKEWSYKYVEVVIEAERLLKGDPTKPSAGFIETCEGETLINFLKDRLVCLKSFSVSDEGKVYFEGMI